jgi:mannose-6-phosphate isomerase-like protein (cupin superfamily)
MNTQNKPQAFEVNNTVGRAYWGMGILWTMLATAEDTNGAYSCIEELIPRGPSAAPHIHEAADESFYIIEGEMTFFIEDRPIKATAGSFVAVPRGTKHAFQIDSETVRLTNTYVPAGFEQIIMVTTVPAQARTLPPASMPLPDLEQTNRAMSEIIQKYPAAKTNFLQGYDG